MLPGEADQDAKGVNYDPDDLFGRLLLVIGPGLVALGHEAGVRLAVRVRAVDQPGFLGLLGLQVVVHLVHYEDHDRSEGGEDEGDDHLLENRVGLHSVLHAPPLERPLGGPEHAPRRAHAGGVEHGVQYAGQAWVLVFVRALVLLHDESQTTGQQPHQHAEGVEGQGVPDQLDLPALRLLRLLVRQVAREREAHHVNRQVRHGQAGCVVLALHDLFLHQVLHHLQALLLPPRLLLTVAPPALDLLPARLHLPLPHDRRHLEGRLHHQLVEHDGQPDDDLGPRLILRVDAHPHEARSGEDRGESRHVGEQHRQSLCSSSSPHVGVSFLLDGNLHRSSPGDLGDLYHAPRGVLLAPPLGPDLAYFVNLHWLVVVPLEGVSVHPLFLGNQRFVPLSLTHHAGLDGGADVHESQVRETVREVEEAHLYVVVFGLERTYQLIEAREKQHGAEDRNGDARDLPRIKADVVVWPVCQIKQDHDKRYHPEKHDGRVKVPRLEVQFLLLLLLLGLSLGLVGDLTLGLLLGLGLGRDLLLGGLLLLPHAGEEVAPQGLPRRGPVLRGEGQQPS
mmetsp:Transcript_123100/g.334319  ORF Transcript_123100/g.334319 Transcript_123100/m.334319 type:complete len:563 (-) Transcript_123100:1091-2779(-)